MTTDHLIAAVDRFLTQGQAQGWAAATVSNYRHFLASVVTQLQQQGCARWADVTPADVDACAEHWAASGVANSSRLRGAVVLRRFGRWLQEQGLVLRSPARSLSLPEGGEPDLLSPPLTEAEVAGLLAGLARSSVYDLRNACLLELLYGCGLRIAEALALNLPDLDLRRQTLLIRESKHGQTRLVPLPGAALAAAQDYLALRRTLLKGPDHGALFLTQQGTRWVRAAVYGLFDRLNAQQGPGARHLHPHLFRHSIAVHLLRRGADIRYIQQFLGHSCLDTTKVYLRLVPGHLKEDYDRAMPEIAVTSGRQ